MLDRVQPTSAHNQEKKGKKEGITAVTVPPPTTINYQSQYQPQTSVLRSSDKSLWLDTFVNWSKVASKESSDLPAFNNSLNFWIDIDSFIIGHISCTLLSYTIICESVGNSRCLRLVKQFLRHTIVKA